jgi:hypothetical protein
VSPSSFDCFLIFSCILTIQIFDILRPPYLDLDVICDTSINRDSQMVVSTLKERGSRAGSDYFQRVEGISAVVKREYTARPTR